jgi:cytochrome P450
MQEVTAYFSELIAERRRVPRDDLVSASLTFEIDGRRVTDDELLSLFLLLFQAGLDTVASQLTYSMFHLATHDDDRRRLVEDPSLIVIAIEEFLRYYSFVPTGRKVRKEGSIGGCPVQPGEMVQLPLSSANRDENEFPNADRVLIDREPNWHIAFGAGPHRCLGSHLARQELCIGLADWHARVPEYQIAPGVELVEHGGMYGLDHLPLQWDVRR